MRQGQQFTCEKATGHPAPGGCAINHFPVTPGEGLRCDPDQDLQKTAGAARARYPSGEAIKLLRPLDDRSLLVIVREGVLPFPQPEPI
jgi:hypothetical protein